MRGAAIARKKSAPCVPVLGDRSALHPLHLGYDGKPKGVVRDNGGTSSR